MAGNINCRSIKPFLYSGLSSTVFTLFLNQTGVLQNVAKTTAPFMRHAFLFGVINGSIQYGAKNLAGRVKQDLTDRRQKEYVDLLEFAVCTVSRYAVARACNKLFNGNITNAFVHVSASAYCIKKYTWLNTPIIACFGFYLAIQAKLISIFVAAPIFKNAFYFGMGFVVANSLARNLYISMYPLIKKHSNMDSSRAFCLFHVFVGVMLLSTSFIVAKMFKQYLNIEISKSCSLVFSAWGLPFVLPFAIIQYIRGDLLKPDVQKIINKFQKSDHPDVRYVFEQIDDILEHTHEISYSLVWRRIQDQGLQQTLRDAIALFNPFFFPLIGRAVVNIFEGDSPETAVVKILEGAMSNREAIDPIIQLIKNAFGVEAGREGSQFILSQVLRKASVSTQNALIERDKERRTVEFVAVKAVCIYVVGSRKEQDPPLFFEEETTERIRDLRALISQNPLLAEGYNTIAKQLEEATTKETNESFFAFTEGLAAGSQELAALENLQEIATVETQMFFANCFNIASKKLDVKSKLDTHLPISGLMDIVIDYVGVPGVPKSFRDFVNEN